MKVFWTRVLGVGNTLLPRSPVGEKESPHPKKVSLYVSSVNLVKASSSQIVASGDGRFSHRQIFFSPNVRKKKKKKKRRSSLVRFMISYNMTTLRGLPHLLFFLSKKPSNLS